VTLRLTRRHGLLVSSNRFRLANEATRFLGSRDGALKAFLLSADRKRVRSLIGICIGMGSLVGGFVPMLWGDSGFSLASVATTALGAVAGLWVALRLEV
jgi:hypothetical protein